MEPYVGMYIHQHWAYKYPYAARTWSFDDWMGYLEGIRALGYNLVQIWPMLETVPNPMTDSDRSHIDKITRVIDEAHRRLDMRVFIVLVPNTIARDAEASRFTFEERPFFYCEDRADPGDPRALADMIAWREEMLRPLAAMDGLSVIDSDPGGYPGSRNHEFVYLMNAHRRMLNRLRPGIELVYWNHTGWEAYARFYETAHCEDGPDSETLEVVQMLARIAPEPWSLLTWRGKTVAEPVGEYQRCIRLHYGAVEGEPSFPMTNFSGESAERARRAASERDPRGVMANAQTHCLQLPNTLVFARAAQGLATTRADYEAFAEQLLPGLGNTIVEGWSLIDAHAPESMRAAAEALEQAVTSTPLRTGSLGGFLLGGAERFLTDIAIQLRMRAALEEFHAAVHEPSPSQARVAETYRAFVDLIGQWQARHGYANHWSWPRMEEALNKLGPGPVTELLERRAYRAEGATPFEQVQNGYRFVETFVPRLIEAMRQAAHDMASS